MAISSNESASSKKKEDAKEKGFTFDNQNIIFFSDGLLCMRYYSVFDESFDKINKIFGGDLPETSNVSWWYDLTGYNYDWTEYKEENGALSTHGINFMFYNDSLKGIGYDVKTSDPLELIEKAIELYGECEYEDGTLYRWKVNDELAYDIQSYYSENEGEMYTMRFISWEW